jgi:hypothetical protein
MPQKLQRPEELGMNNTLFPFLPYEFDWEFTYNPAGGFTGANNKYRVVIKDPDGNVMTTYNLPVIGTASGNVNSVMGNPDSYYTPTVVVAASEIEITKVSIAALP